MRLHVDALLSQGIPNRMRRPEGTGELADSLAFHH